MTHREEFLRGYFCGYEEGSIAFKGNGTYVPLQWEIQAIINNILSPQSRISI